jgi:hypothetical protein
MKQFVVTMETENAIDHADGNKRKGIKVFRLTATDKEEAKSLAEQSAREERAQVVLNGADEKKVPVYKVKRTEGI